MADSAAKVKTPPIRPRIYRMERDSDEGGPDHQADETRARRAPFADSFSFNANDSEDDAQDGSDPSPFGRSLQPEARLRDRFLHG